MRLLNRLRSACRGPVAWSAAAGVLLTVALLILILPGRAGSLAGSLPASGRRTAVGGAGRGADAPSAMLQARVSLVRGAATTPIPNPFLGLSTEYWTLPVWERHLSIVERVLAQLHAFGSGPLLLRVGGDSADHAFWEPPGREAPEWAFEVTPGWLAGTRDLIAQTGTQVILDLNLVTATPAIGAQWARAARAALPRGSIAGLEVGNEPDIYSRLSWLAALTGIHRGQLPSEISADGYARSFVAYARALARAAPGVPMLGPALADPELNVGWISILLARARSHLGAITAHRYPYSACAAAGTPGYPTVQRILSAEASAGLAGSVRPAVGLARRAGLPFRLTEMNSVTCGGRPGVSDTFATALWAPDALFELVRAGVSSADIHVRARAINAAFAFDRAGLVAHPLLYGLVAFTRMLGPQSRLVPVAVRAPAVLALKVWAVSSARDRLRVLLIDKGGRAVRVLLRLAARGTATVQRLLAPSVTADSGVTLAGQWLGAGGRWRGRAVLTRVARHAGSYPIALPRHSAAIVSLDLAPQVRRLLNIPKTDPKASRSRSSG
ncbi:MAG: glycosyl hydrolase family 79 C-terminal domain-containing protein [Solirubrobacteraceae bacterium]